MRVSLSVQRDLRCQDSVSAVFFTDVTLRQLSQVARRIPQVVVARELRRYSWKRGSEIAARAEVGSSVRRWHVSNTDC